MEDNFVIDVDNLTLGQTEFITDYSGLSLNELQVRFETLAFDTKDLIAIMCVASNPEDPEAALPEVRAIKLVELADIDVVFADKEGD